MIMISPISARWFSSIDNELALRGVCALGMFSHAANCTTLNIPRWLIYGTVRGRRKKQKEPNEQMCLHTNCTKKAWNKWRNLQKWIAKNEDGGESEEIVVMHVRHVLMAAQQCATMQLFLGSPRNVSSTPKSFNRTGREAKSTSHVTNGKFYPTRWSPNLINFNVWRFAIRALCIPCMSSRV